MDELVVESLYGVNLELIVSQYLLTQKLLTNTNTTNFYETLQCKYLE